MRMSADQMDQSRGEFSLEDSLLRNFNIHEIIRASEITLFLKKKITLNRVQFLLKNISYQS